MAKMGRPKKPKAHRRSVKITFRATMTMRKDLEKQANREKKTLGTYIAGVLQDTLERGE